ncbi:Apoptosis-inducing factor 2 [Termitomyces sp. T112]|nr:hypothetical protein C0989_005095 [Termitomyces sp. Mn162]KAG5725817.1 Apoptosis-inducing factor 2 [Termitomyces sp. T112]
MAKRNIVIVGGGSAGVNTARALSKTLDSTKYELILINPLPYRIWLVATLRLAVTQDEALKNDIFLPYDKVFINGHGKFVQGKVVSFEQSKEGGSVTLESGEKIDYHILLLSQGSNWNGPPDFPHTDTGVQEHISSLHSKLANARHIVLAGGGAVGIELAGEIKDQWPDKKVTIVHGDKLLLNSAYPDKVRKAAAASLTVRGVELVLDHFINEAETKEVQGITTASGKELQTADLVVQTRGPRPNTAFVSDALGESALSTLGLIKIRPTFQLADHDNIFAAGDVIDWKEQKQAAKSSGHGKLVAGNIQAFLDKTPLKSYKGAFEMIVITNGKNSGLAYFDVLWGITLGGWFARLVKSRSLLVPIFKGEQGY